MLIFDCEVCGAQLKLKDESAGKKIRCPSCRAVVIAPDDSPAAISSSRGIRRRNDDDETLPTKANAAAAVSTEADPKMSGKALASLLLSLGNFCVPFILSVPGVIVGILAITDINRRKGKLTGMWMAISGIVLSIVGDIALAVLGVVSFLVGGTIFAMFLPLLILLGMADAQRQMQADMQQGQQNRAQDLVKAKELPDLVKGVRNAANKQATINNLKQIALAMHSYQDVNKRIPPAPGMDLKNPDQLNLSWRVGILPFLENLNLHNQFDQKVAWDQQPNQKLLGQRPSHYDTPFSAPPDPTTTFIQLCTGPNTLFPDTKTVVKIPASIPDGTSNTIFAVQATAGAVPWTKPADIVMSPPGQPLPAGLQAGPNQGFIVSMCDGSARFINRTRVSDQVLRLLIDPKDGQKLPPGWDAE